MNGKRNAYQKAYYAANKPFFAAYRRENSVLIAKYASGYYRENQRRYAEGQRGFCKRPACAWAGHRPPWPQMWA